MTTHNAYILSSTSEPLKAEIVPTTQPKAGQALIKVLAAPIGAYAQNATNGKLFPIITPSTPGPSAIGRVEAVGADSTGLKLGQLVYVDPTIRSRDGDEIIFQGWMSGFSPAANKLAKDVWRDGSWSEKLIAPLENVFPLDEETLIKTKRYTVAQLSKIVTLLVPYGGYEAAKLEAGETVIVAFATGSFGGAGIDVALAMGAGHVVAVVRSVSSLEAVQKRYGVDRVSVVVVTGDESVDGPALKAATPRGAGAEVFLDLSPSAAKATASSLVRSAISALTRGGRVILMGGIEGDISIPYGSVMLRNIQINGVWMYTSKAPRKIISMIETGRISLDEFKTETFGFDRLEDAIKRAVVASNASGSVVFCPTIE